MPLEFDPRVRRNRQERDYQGMLRLRQRGGGILDFDAEFPPAPERYVVRMKLKSIMGLRGNDPVYSKPGHVHVIEIIIPRHYPAETFTRAHVKFLSEMICHPHVHTDGHFCVGSSIPEESLPRFVLRLAEMVRFNPRYINPDSLANSTIISWYLANKHWLANRGLDPVVLPDPDEKLAIAGTIRNFR